MVELQVVLDGRVDVIGAPVREHVGANLRQSDLEVHDVGVVRLSAGGLAQELDGFMKLLQTFIKLAERGVELKRLARLIVAAVRVRSQ